MIPFSYLEIKAVILDPLALKRQNISESWNVISGIQVTPGMFSNYQGDPYCMISEQKL